MKSSSSFRGVQVRKWFVFLACVDIVWTLHGCQKSDLRPEVFNCSFSNLTSYPSNVPADVTILDVSHNALEKIGILNTTFITHLNLSNNIIQNVQHNAFTDMKNLVKLDCRLICGIIQIKRLSFLKMAQFSWQSAGLRIKNDIYSVWISETRGTGLVVLWNYYVRRNGPFKSCEVEKVASAI